MVKRQKQQTRREPRHPRSKPARRAFTLIEMMVSAILAAFIALVALAGLRGVIAARAAVDRHSEAVDELRIAVEQIRRDLVNVMPFGRSLRFEGLVEETDFGSSSRLIFRTFSRDKARVAEPEGDFYEVEYYVTQSAAGKALMRRVCPMLGLTASEQEKTDGGIVEVLAEPIASFDVGYFDSGNWQTQWSAQNQRPPQLVLVNLATEDSQSSKPRLYARQVSAGFNQGTFTEETNASEFDWQTVEGQWQQTETMQ